jgi:capsular exopolysaccharide synthesis family protein
MPRNTPIHGLRGQQDPPTIRHTAKGIVRVPRTTQAGSGAQKGTVALNDLLRVFWQRKLLIVLVTLAVVIPAFAATKLVTKQYESTATLALTPKGTGNDLLLFSQLDTIAPFYADGATSRPTLENARRRLGRPLSSISVESFKGTGILKIKARGPKPRLTQLSAAAVTNALIDRVEKGDVGIPSLKLSLVDPPALPTTPVFPRTRLTLFVALLLGLGLGFAAALLRENLTTKIESADDLAEASGLPVFAEIPAEGAVLKMTAPEDLATHPRLRVVAEALRDLRTNLLFTDESIRSIVITSPDGSHGKTTVSFALAATLARAGAKTLLIDADLRRGRVAELLELSRSPGLMDVLLGEAELEQAIRRTRDDLDVLVGGRRSADPGELLTQAFPALLSRLEREYEAIIIDTTPVIPISDARILARFADATVLVAGSGTASRRQVRQAVERLGLISVKPTAAVLNYSPEVSSSSYYVRPTEADAETRSSRRRRARKRDAASSN